MKTYFMAWESDRQRGHSIWDFEDGILPREALENMIKSVASDNKMKIDGTITAKQFNRID